MNKNNPVRLHKKEEITITYDATTVYLTGALFIAALVILAFGIGTENFNFLLGSCIWMAYRIPKTIRKDLNSIHEIRTELSELSKLKIMASSGRISKKQYFISIDKPEAIEVRIYTLSNGEYYSAFKKAVENKEFKI